MPYQMKNGKWRAKRMICGELRTKVFSTKHEAKRWETEQSREQWAQQETPTISLLDAATAYLDFSKARHHETTYKNKLAAIRLLFASLTKSATPDDVTSALALSVVMRKAKASGNKMANQLRKHLAAFWEHGVEFNSFPKHNPFASIKRLPEDRTHHYVPPVEDFWKVYAMAEDADRVMLLGLLYTGGRRSEPMRWTWEEDIDLIHRRIRLSTCKTRDGSRKYEWMSMPSRLHDALALHKTRTGGHGHVFTSRTGEAYKCRNQFIRRLCVLAGVKHFNYHGIRGLCASLLAEGGVNMKDIQTVLMHSSMTTTDRYIRNLGKTSDVLASAFDSFDKTKTASKVVPFEAVCDNLAHKLAHA